MSHDDLLHFSMLPARHPRSPVVYHSSQRLTAKTTTMSTAIITIPANTSTGVTVMIEQLADMAERHWQAGLAATAATVFSDGSKLTGVIPSLVRLFCDEHLIAALLPHRANLAFDGADLIARFKLLVIGGFRIRLFSRVFRHGIPL